MQTNVVISSKGTGSQAGKKINTTITYLRDSEKDKATLLAQTLNALTTNNFESSSINQLNVNPSQSGKTEPILTIGESSRLFGNANWITFSVTFTYNGDGHIFHNSSNNYGYYSEDAVSLVSLEVYTSDSIARNTPNTITLMISRENHANELVEVTIKLSATEGNVYAAKTVEKTLSFQL